MPDFEFNHKQNGFTLLEIMLVVLLMGMISMGVVMTLPSHFISKDNPQWQAKRFSVLVQVAEDEALISGVEYGLVFGVNSYQFATYDYQRKKWIAAEREPLHNKIKLPDKVNLKFMLSDSIWGDELTESKTSFIKYDELVHIKGEKEVVSLTPQVYIMASGEVTPFSVTFNNMASDNSKQVSSEVSVGMNGTLKLMDLNNESL